jgi:hypothetical protein
MIVSDIHAISKNRDLKHRFGKKGEEGFAPPSYQDVIREDMSKPTHILRHVDGTIGAH